MQQLPNILRSIAATIRFETSRILRTERLIVALVMVLFPPVMIMILEQSGANPAPEFSISILCGLVCLLSLLLWATSNVYTELEGRSWTFVTSRPHGRWSILFGKFFIAFGWSFLISWLALTLCMFIDFQSGFQSGEPRAEIWFIFTILLFLASLSYSTIFSLMGVIILRRAMMVAVGYFLIVEMVLAWIPAMIAKVAMTHHMFAIVTQRLGVILPGGDEDLDQIAQFWNIFPAWVHYIAIFAMTGFCLSVAAIIIRVREYMTLEESNF